MIVWVDGAHGVVGNMRRDATLLAAAAARRTAVLRLFAFQPHGITLGHAQDPGRVLDLARCDADGIAWALRPTGGRAIFHAEEWTYALATPIDDPVWGGSLATAYDRVSSLIARSLARLGVPAALAGTHGASRGTPPGPSTHAPCFASTARHEIVIEGRKLVGSAQRRTADALLQQGSVLLGQGHLRLADYLAIPEAARAATRERLAVSALDAGRWLGPDPPLERWADAILPLLPAGAVRVDGSEWGTPLAPPAPGAAAAGFA